MLQPQSALGPFARYRGRRLPQFEEIAYDNKVGAVAPLFRNLLDKPPQRLGPPEIFGGIPLPIGVFANAKMQVTDKDRVAIRRTGG